MFSSLVWRGENVKGGKYAVPSENHIASADDFKKAVEHAAAERVVLPGSGLPVILRRPTPLAVLIIAKEGSALQANLSNGKPEDIVAFADWMTKVLTSLFIQPRLSLSPGPGEISPDWLLQKDIDFIFRWMRGEVGTLTPRPSPDGRGERDEGVDLERFHHRESRPSSKCSSGGENVVVSSESDARADWNDGFPI